MTFSSSCFSRERQSEVTGWWLLRDIDSATVRANVSKVGLGAEVFARQMVFLPEIRWKSSDGRAKIGKYLRLPRSWSIFWQIFTSL